MEHEVVPRPSKICDWLLNSSHDHFGLHQKKKCQSDHGVWGPQRTYFEAYIVHWHGPTDYWWERPKRCYIRKRQGPMTEKSCYINFFMKCFFREEKMKTRAWSNLILIFLPSQNCIFGAYIKTISTFTFWCMVIPLGPHLVHTWWGAQRLCILIL